MNIKGKIKFIGETVSFGTNNFRKRELVITTEDQYPQHILVEFTQDKCDILDKYQVGQLVNVDINLRGREWVNPQGETKYFNSIQGWKISKVDDGESGQQGSYQQAPQSYGQHHTTYQQPVNYREEDHDDLPF